MPLINMRLLPDGLKQCAIRSRLGASENGVMTRTAGDMLRCLSSQALIVHSWNVIDELFVL
jgi:hypothetical protein